MFPVSLALPSAFIRTLTCARSNLRFLTSQIYVPSNLVDTVTEVKTAHFHTPKPGTEIHNVTVQDFQSAVTVFDFP